MATSANSANPSHYKQWLDGSPGFNIRKGVNPVNFVRSAGTAGRLALTTKLGLAGTGLLMYGGMSPQQAMYETMIGGGAFIAGARIGSGIGQGLAGMVGRRGAKFAEDVASGAGKTLPKGATYSASKYVGLGGKFVGALAGGLALGVAASSLYDVAASAPRKMIERGRKLREMEMGGNFHDPFGTAYTMRQRSMQGIQRSHINARNALGNEAFYSHVR